MFVGNGAHLHQDLIKEIFENRATISSLQICSVGQIAKIALEKWKLASSKEKKDLSYKLYPLYLKSQKFAIK